MNRQLAVDVGYGYTKAVSDDGHRICFPSAVAPVRGSGDLGVVIGSGDPPYRIELHASGQEVERLWVGEAALVAGATRSWNTEASGRTDYERLVLAALALLQAEGPIELLVGLPMTIWLQKAERRQTRERLRGLSGFAAVDGEAPRYVEVQRCRVLPQALGAYVAALHEALAQGNGDRLAHGMVGVLDLGYRTCDYTLLVSAPNGEGLVPSEAHCGSLDRGVGGLYQNIRQQIEHACGRMLPPAAVEEALQLYRGRLVVHGVEYHVDEMLKVEQSALAFTVGAELRRAWGERFELLHVLLVSGGGGLACWDQLRTLHPRTELQKDSLFANAVGFQYFGATLLDSEKPANL